MRFRLCVRFTANNVHFECVRLSAATTCWLTRNVRLRLVFFSFKLFICIVTMHRNVPAHSHCFVWCHACVLLLAYFSSNPFLLCFPLKLVSTKLSLFSSAVCVFRPFLIGFSLSFRYFLVCLHSHLNLLFLIFYRFRHENIIFFCSQHMHAYTTRIRNESDFCRLRNNAME